MSYALGMSIDLQRAFDALIRAFEEFHAAVLDAEDPEAPRVLHAADALADAYTVYDDVLYTSFGVEAPFDTFTDEQDDDIDLEDDEDDDAYDGGFEEDDYDELDDSFDDEDDEGAFGDDDYLEDDEDDYFLDDEEYDE